MTTKKPQKLEDTGLKAVRKITKKRQGLPIDADQDMEDGVRAVLYDERDE